MELKASTDISDKQRLADVDNERRWLYEWFNAFISDERIKREMDPTIRNTIRNGIISEITTNSKQRLALKKRLGTRAIS